MDLDEAAADEAEAVAGLDGEEVALAKHRACEAIVIGEVARALGTNRSMDLLLVAKLLLHDFMEMAGLFCRREEPLVRQAGRAVVDKEAFEQHRMTADWDWAGATLGRRRARVLKDEDMVGIWTAPRILYLSIG